MTLKDLVQADVDSVILNTDDFAEEVTYTPPGGAVATLNALLNRGPMAVVEGGPAGTWQAHTARILVSLTDLTAPARGATVASTSPAGGTETWLVDSWEYDEGGWWLNCTRQEDREIHGTGYRKVLTEG